MTITHASFTVDRTLSHPPQHVFRAFADETLKQRWFRESDDPAGHFALDFRIDGRESSVFHIGQDETLPPHIRGAAIANETVFHDITENQRIVYSYRMTINGDPMSVSLVTIELAHAPGGTHLTYTEQGAYYPNADGPEMRKAGWTDLLDRLVATLSSAAVPR